MGPELPQRLQNRWNKYHAAYQNENEHEDYSFRRGEQNQTVLDSVVGSIGRRRRASIAADPHRLSFKTKKLLKKHSSSMDMEGIRHAEAKRRWSVAARKSILAKKDTFANMADASLAQASSQMETKEEEEEKAKQRQKGLGNENNDDGGGATSVILEMAALESELNDTYDLDQDEFNKCRTIEERKSMIKTLNDLGKARQQYCRFVKEKYWHVYEEGLLDKAAFRDLADAEDAMIDMTDRYFVTLNHHIAPILDKDEALVDNAWKNFRWEDFVVKGELQSFTRTLQNLTNIPHSITVLSTILCCSCLMKRHLYFFVSRARDIAANFVHAHEAVIRHIEHNKLFPSEIAEHIICEAEFQIMAAKTVLHNIDKVFPEIAAHLQTIRASRYLLRQEESNLKKYLRSGELSTKEHDSLLDAVLKSLQKLSSHPKPHTLTPNFQKLLMESDRHKETFGRVISQLSLEESYGLLQMLASGSQMVYLRAGDLVYEQGTTKDHTGNHKNKIGIYYIARGAVTSVWVPGEIRKHRKQREEQYMLELHRIRKTMLQSLISKKRLERAQRRDSNITVAGHRDRARSSLQPNGFSTERVEVEDSSFKTESSMMSDVLYTSVGTNSDEGGSRTSSPSPSMLNRRKSPSPRMSDDGTIGYRLTALASLSSMDNRRSMDRKESSFSINAINGVKEGEKNSRKQASSSMFKPTPGTMATSITRKSSNQFSFLLLSYCALTPQQHCCW
jgi:hypothetical protein